VQSQGNTQYLSLVLYPGVDPPPDMAKPLDMAMTRADMSGDLAVPAGAADMGSGGGAHSGCDSSAGGGASASGFIVALVLFLGAASIFRRRHE
jgi:MYXO-CTERM domain-containing protein